MSTQWHPPFTALLRVLMLKRYDLQTDQAVGDAPRHADLVLLRRTDADLPPFQGLWSHLTTWNVLEYKGPTVSPRRGDLDLLVELGLGIHRRLNEERRQNRQAAVDADEVSFWYLAQHLGRRFLRMAEHDLGTALEPVSAGVWRSQVLRRSVFLVSNNHLPVELDTLPLHVLGSESEDTQRAIAHLVGRHPDLWDVYAPWIAAFHETASKELLAMSRTAQRVPKPNFEALIRVFGLRPVIEQIGLDRVIAEVGPKKVIAELGMDCLLENLTPAQRKELKRRLQ